MENTGNVNVSDLEDELLIPPRSVRYYLSDDSGLEFAAQAVANGGVVTHGFANFYAIVSRPEREVVVRINRMKGRPDGQIGSVSTTPLRIAALSPRNAATSARRVSAWSSSPPRRPTWCHW
jgi:tRNA A37 threonylcarbamoyladenosine synthetase subunit TsaC/SUA5/YrdC